MLKFCVVFYVAYFYDLIPVTPQLATTAHQQELPGTRE